LVLADSLYGESGVYRYLYELKPRFAVAIRSNHTVLLPKGQKVKADGENLNGFTGGNKEVRYIREIILVNAALNSFASYY